MIVQIYEIQDPQEAEACIESGVDQIGCVLFSEEEWHQSLLKETIQISRAAGVKNSLLPLFRDEDTIHRILDFYTPTYLHFCDSLTNHLAQQEVLESMISLQDRIKEKFPEVGIIRTIPIPRKGKAYPDFPYLEMARAFTRVTDIFLIDTWVENAPVEGFVGITGQTADRDIAADLVLYADIPVILAGGLSAENVHEAILKVFPAGADSCTQTNEVDGSGNVIRFKKDFNKVKKFVGEVRKAEKSVHQEKARLTLELNALKEKLEDREAALPAHSIRPHQLLVIEELEEEIALKERELKRLRYGVASIP